MALLLRRVQMLCQYCAPGAENGPCRLIFIRGSEWLPAACGEATIENLVREEPGLFETRDSAGNECGNKSLYLCAVALETGM